MANKNIILPIVVAGLAIHGAITACSHVDSGSLDARAEAQGNTGVPSGTIVAFGGTTIPNGWLPCDGSAVSRTTYETLFAAIGNHFGSGDGVNTFNLPDLRGRFVRGVDGGTGRDPDAGNRTASNSGGLSGDVVGSLQDYATATPANPFVTETAGNHTHENGVFNRLLTVSGLGTTASTDSSPGEPNITTSAPMVSTGAHIHRLGGGFGVGGDKETRPKNVAVNFIIKF